MEKSSNKKVDDQAAIKGTWGNKEFADSWSRIFNKDKEDKENK